MASANSCKSDVARGSGDSAPAFPPLVREDLVAGPDPRAALAWCLPGEVVSAIRDFRSVTVFVFDESVAC
jgi:hypothetical protein